MTHALPSFRPGDRVIFRDNRCVVTDVHGGPKNPAGYLRVLEPGPDSRRAVGDELFAWAVECEPDDEVL